MADNETLYEVNRIFSPAPILYTSGKAEGFKGRHIRCLMPVGR